MNQKDYKRDLSNGFPFLFSEHHTICIKTTVQINFSLVLGKHHLWCTINKIPVAREEVTILLLSQCCSFTTEVELLLPAAIFPKYFSEQQRSGRNPSLALAVAVVVHGLDFPTPGIKYCNLNTISKYSTGLAWIFNFHAHIYIKGNKIVPCSITFLIQLIKRNM